MHPIVSYEIPIFATRNFLGGHTCLKCLSKHSDTYIISTT